MFRIYKGEGVKGLKYPLTKIIKVSSFVLLSFLSLAKRLSMSVTVGYCYKLRPNKHQRRFTHKDFFLVCFLPLTRVHLLYIRRRGLAHMSVHKPTSCHDIDSLQVVGSPTYINRRLGNS